MLQCDYIIKRGETLYSISRDYRVSIAQLLAANPSITNMNVIYVGQTINIPGLPEPSTIPYRIVISKGNSTLQLFRNNTLIKTYPIAVGKMLTQTPVGTFVVVNRATEPWRTIWCHVAKSFQKLDMAFMAQIIQPLSVKLFHLVVFVCIIKMYLNLQDKFQTGLQLQFNR